MTEQFKTLYTILNDLDSYEAIPIYSYVVNMERKK